MLFLNKLSFCTIRENNLQSYNIFLNGDQKVGKRSLKNVKRTLPGTFLKASDVKHIVERR